MVCSAADRTLVSQTIANTTKQQRAKHGSRVLADSRRTVPAPHGGDGAKQATATTGERTLDCLASTSPGTDFDTYVLTLSSHAARQQTPRWATGIPVNVNRLQYITGTRRFETHPTARSSFTAPAQRNSDDSTGDTVSASPPSLLQRNRPAQWQRVT